VIGLAVTREGIPVRVWCWPGNTNDMTVLEQVKDDLRGWRLGRVVTVVDRGFASDDNLAYLTRAGGHWIAGERLRDTSADVAQVLSRQGRYQSVRDNLRVKEVRLGQGDGARRFVLCHPEQAERDRPARPARLGRWLRQTPGGRLMIDRAKVRAEQRLDGKFLLSTSAPDLSAEDVALSYKNLLEAERCFRDRKTTLELRPVYHHLERRIRAHVLLCRLALLLGRVAERQTGHTWRRINLELGRLHLVTWPARRGGCSTSASSSWPWSPPSLSGSPRYGPRLGRHYDRAWSWPARHTTVLTPSQRELSAATGVTPPPRVTSLQPS